MIYDPRTKITNILDENGDDEWDNEDDADLSDLETLFSAKEQEELIEIMNVLDDDCRFLFDPHWDGKKN